MQILANALPGFRDMRAPLTAGYLWLLFAWLVVKPDTSTRPANATAAAVYDLATGVGPIWLGLGAGTIAYLLGSVTQIATDYVEANYSKEARSRRTMLRELADDPSHRYLRVAEMPSGEQIADTYRSIKQILATDEAKASPNYDEWEGRATGGQYRAMSRSGEELDMPATLLIADEPTLFAEVDRMRAEGELRIAVAPPLVFLVGLLTIQVSLWLALGLGPVAALALQGRKRKQESRALIRDAMRVERIKSPAAQTYRDAMTQLGQEIRSEAAPRGRAVRARDISAEFKLPQRQSD